MANGKRFRNIFRNISQTGRISSTNRRHEKGWIMGNQMCKRPDFGDEKERQKRKIKKNIEVTKNNSSEDCCFIYEHATSTLPRNNSFHLSYS